LVLCFVLLRDNLIEGGQVGPEGGQVVLDLKCLL